MALRRLAGRPGRWAALWALSVPLPLGAQDTLLVRADGPPLWGDGVALERELRIGSLDGGSGPALGRVAGLAVLEDGEIWIADAHGPRILRFAPDGRPVGEVGGPGRGPGEYRRLDGLARLPDGSVAAWDAPVSVHVFGPDGRFLRRIPAGGSSIWPGRETFRVDTAGRPWVLDASGDTPEARHDAEAWRVLAADGTDGTDGTDGAAVRSVPVPPARRHGPRWAAQHYGRDALPAFARVTLSAPSPLGYLVRARNDAYRIERPTTDGRIVALERAWEPVAVDPGERRAFQAREDAFSARRGVAPGEVPARKPPFWTLWVDQEGRIWVGRHASGERVPETDDERVRRERVGNPPLEWWEPRAYDVLEPNGRFLGTVRLPATRSEPWVARGDRLWVVERGAFDEEYVVRYRLRAADGTPLG